MAVDDDNKPVEVFSGTAWQAETVKAMLEDNEIEAFFGDEIWGSDAPMNSSAGTAGSVMVYVKKLDLEDAKIAIERYYEDITEEEQGF